MDSALKPFRILAYVVGVMLLVLVTCIVLRYGFDIEGPSKIVSPIHGFLYMLYLVAAMNLGMKARWSWPYIVGVMLAGTVPLLSFVFERKVTRRVAAELAAAPTPA
ncbi:integral membrane protein [Streptosporangium canum]|uniref:Integral membrane protein n=1 Tax=Streptosporangium canum TaxID=324952 RepID=A0A1I3IRB8_9ACTN|nr:integral membrane protein [Streptosporangium canum]